VAYLDAASGERLHPAAREALAAAQERGWADPARLYSDARRARALLDQSRAVVAAAVGARPDQVSFTASGTQANHLAVLGAVRAPSSGTPGRTRVVASAVEHSSVLRAGQHVEYRGGELTSVGVDAAGRLDLQAWSDALDPGAGAGSGGAVALACLQAANHEVGTVQPVAAAGAVCAERGVPLLVDAAQAVSRLDVAALPWSLLTASAHKWGGPAGVGVLAVRPDARWRSPLPGDEREGGRVAGFENVPAIVAAAAALEAVGREAAVEDARLSRLVDRIRAEVTRLVPDVEVVGDPVARLPHLVTFSVLYVDGEALVTAMDRAGFAVSSGSSCTASTLEPSHVLVAMGALSHGNVRVSLPRGTDEADVDRFLSLLPTLVADLRADADTAGL
jgi:cysteine desulfurase